MAKERETHTTELEVGSSGTNSLVISGNIPNLHDDPQKVHQLLDLLGMPKGTQVRLTTTAISVIVR
jgi:hypothetical protein